MQGLALTKATQHRFPELTFGTLKKPIVTYESYLTNWISDLQAIYRRVRLSGVLSRFMDR